jgi:hypothetical protein
MTIRGIAARPESNSQGTGSLLIKERADGTIHGHVWLPTGECAAFIIEN